MNANIFATKVPDALETLAGKTNLTEYWLVSHYSISTCFSSVQTPSRVVKRNHKLSCFIGQSRKHQ